MRAVAQTVEQLAVVTASDRRQCPLCEKVAGSIPAVSLTSGEKHG
jgi:hypothetical protein